MRVFWRNFSASTGAILEMKRRLHAYVLLTFFFFSLEVQCLGFSVTSVPGDHFISGFNVPVPSFWSLCLKQVVLQIFYFCKHIHCKRPVLVPKGDCGFSELLCLFLILSRAAMMCFGCSEGKKNVILEVTISKAFITTKYDSPLSCASTLCLSCLETS